MKVLRPPILLLICLMVLSVCFVCAQNHKGDDLFVVIVNDKRGYIDRTGKIVIEPKWGGANDFSEGLAIVATYEGGYRQGYIDTEGKVIIPLQYAMARDFSEGLAAVGFGEFGLHNSGDHKTGFIDKTGKLVIEPKFRDAASFSEGLAVVYDKGKHGYINKKGKLVIPLKFDDAQSFSEGLACVKIGEKFGFIDKKGNIVIQPKYSLPSVFKEGLANVTTGGKASPSYGGYLIENEGKPMFIDKRGKVIIKFGSDVKSARAFSEGLAAVEVEKDTDITLTGFINRTGKFVISPKYEDVDNFSEGLAQFMFNGKWTYLNQKGEIAFSTDFDLAKDFERGLAWIQQGGLGGFENFRNAKYGYIDKTGKVIWQPTK